MEHNHSHHHEHEHREGNERAEIIKIAFSAAISAAILLLRSKIPVFLPNWLMFLLPYLLVGGDVLIEAVKNIFKGRIFDEKFLMSLATAGAFAVEEYPEAVAVMAFYKIGELFEHRAVERAHRSIEQAMDLRPDTAVVIKNGRELTVHPHEIAPGEIFVVKPGEKIALDGIIISGETDLDTSALTGEALPRPASPENEVLSGCVNLSGLIKVRATKEFEQSTAAKISELARQASSRKARAENFITKFSRWYTPAVVGAAALIFAVPSLITGRWTEWLGRALVFLVVSCPCALVVSVPLTFFCGIGGASRKGILIKGSAYIDALAQIKTVAFDKTGTLTKGEFKVKIISPQADISPESLLCLAAAAEAGSNHPIAKSICSAAGNSIAQARQIKELAGMGICAEVNGEKIAVGNEKLMKLCSARPVKAADGICIHVARGNEYLGSITLEDELKPESAAAITALKKAGIEKTALVTGDGSNAARAVAKAAGIDEYYSSLLPDGKIEAAEKLLKQGSLCFVGDGVNDAPVLARADVGIAMGAAGSDAAIEAADVVIMDDNPEKVAAAIAGAKHTLRIVRQNITLALGVKGAVLLLGALGITGMWLAVFADVGVTVIAVLNALRARK